MSYPRISREALRTTWFVVALVFGGGAAVGGLMHGDYLTLGIGIVTAWIAEQTMYRLR
jgi:hypothetical protein